MTLLYIHGLMGSLTPEKRQILERYAEVISPSIDYENHPDSIREIYERYKNSNIGAIIGSSMGGFATYHLAKLFQVPALAFNPALAERSVHQNIPDTPLSSNAVLHIVLGAIDPIVDPKGTLHFLSDRLNQPQNYNIHIRHDLAHRIPLAVFEQESTRFLESVLKISSRKKRLFLDDIRTVDMVYDNTFTSEFDVVRSFDAFKSYIEKNGLPDFISFDNDLGLDDNDNIAPDGLAAAKWLVYKSGLDLRHLEFKVHSSNPVAAEQICGLLNNYLKFLNTST